MDHLSVTVSRCLLIGAVLIWPLSLICGNRPRRSNPSDKWQTDWVSEEQPPCAPALFLSLCKYERGGKGGSSRGGVNGESGQTGGRRASPGRGLLSETPGLQREVKARSSRGQRGSPAFCRDSSGCQSRWGLPPRYHAASRAAFPSNKGSV